MSDSDDDSDNDSDFEQQESAMELKKADIVLSQMRRGAQKKGGQSKLRTRYEGLQSYGDMMKAHALKRMQDGLRKLLSLHSATELSSICGCLQLKAQLKGATSVEQILKYASETEEMNDEKIKKILNFMWEGALWEYLHSIGHPVHSMLLDPKMTILKIWEDGGFLSANKTFIPHFIAREVKKRYEWVQSEDIRSRLDKLRTAQEVAKRAERKVVSEHDYTNILTYFTQMGELRKMENSVREYLISELEIARSRVDSSVETAELNRKQLKDNELYFISVCEALNEKLAYTEQVCETLQVERFEIEKDLQRLSVVLDSYMECARDREVSGGGHVQALAMKESENCVHSIRVLHRKLQNYSALRNRSDGQLRDRTRAHIEEIDRLEMIVSDLEEQLSDKIDDTNFHEARATRAEKELMVCARRLMKQDIKKGITTDQGWDTALRFASQVSEYQLTFKRLKPLLVAGLFHPKNALVADVCCALLRKLPIVTDPVEFAAIMETYNMGIEDRLSGALRKMGGYNDKKVKASTVSSSGPPSPKKAVSKGKAGSSAAKKKSGNSSDNDTVRSKNTVGSGKSSSSKTAGSPANKSSSKTSSASTPIKEKKPGSSSSAKKPTPAKSPSKGKK